MQRNFRILFIGDIVGKPGREAIIRHIGKLQESLSPDFTIVNVENSAHGFGITWKIYQELERVADCLTGGNHIFDKEETFKDFKNMSKLVRPANVSHRLPGVGAKVFEKHGIKIGVTSLLGRIFMEPVDNPFTTMENLLENEFANVSIKVVDFHAEATSEKIAFGKYFNGKLTAVIGTHTHVQTADETILSQGTAYITDVGMTGCHGGIIGFNKQEIFDRLIWYMKRKLTVCNSEIIINGCCIDTTLSGEATSISRIRLTCQSEPNTTTLG